MQDYATMTIEELTDLAVTLRDDIDFDCTCEQACTQHIGMFAQYTRVIEEIERRNNEEAAL